MPLPEAGKILPLQIGGRGFEVACPYFSKNKKIATLIHGCQPCVSQKNCSKSAS